MSEDRPQAEATASADATVGDQAKADEATPKKKSSFRKAVDNRTAMYVFLFGAAMVTGLPFLWMSGGFSKVEKIVISIIVVIYTIVVFALFGLVMWWAIAQIVEAVGMSR